MLIFQRSDYMTQQRRFNGGTNFGLWLRRQNEIDSSLGYVTSDVDYIWLNYQTQQWIMIEEKTHGKDIARYQDSILSNIDLVCSVHDKNYKGKFVLIFENTAPDDGEIYLRGSIKGKYYAREKITRDFLIDLLTFSFWK